MKTLGHVIKLCAVLRCSKRLFQLETNTILTFQLRQGQSYCTDTECIDRMYFIKEKTISEYKLSY